MLKPAASEPTARQRLCHTDANYAYANYTCANYAYTNYTDTK
jgi:hypothetical protein